MKKRMFLMIRILLLSTLVASGITTENQLSEPHSDEIPAFDAMAQLQTQYGLEIGQKAPDFSLEGIDGKNITLSDYQGRKVLLNFWASWCPPCREEMPIIQKVYQESQEDIIVIAVNITNNGESKQSAKSFADQYGLTFPIPLDPEGKVTDLYQILPIPTTYFLDEEGVIRAKYFGPMTEEYILDQFERMYKSERFNRK